MNGENQSIVNPVKGDSIGLERLVFFSDAVFAIAITLLALDIHLPAGAAGELNNAELLTALMSIWPKYLGYVVSFLVIGVMWIGHHRRFRWVQRYDTNMLLLNLILLMGVAFIPFPTTVLSEYGNRTATIFYALTMVVLGLLSMAQWRYISSKKRLLLPQTDLHLIRRELLRSLGVPTIFLLSIGIAVWNPDAAMFSWILVALVFKFL